MRTRSAIELIEPIWLGAALERARSCPDSIRERARELTCAARVRLEAAGRLREQRFAAAALALEREGLTLAVKARELLPDPRPDPVEIEDGAAVRPELVRLLAVLEFRDPRAVRFARFYRIALLAMATAVFVLFVRQMVADFAQVARYKPVTASSVAGSIQPLAVVDGSLSKRSTFATDNDPSPWIQIDLIGRYRIARVVVHPAGDGTRSEMLPLVLEGTTDFEHFVELASRRDPFNARAPWQIDLGGRELNAIRLRHPGRGAIAVAEIEAIQAR
jgi:hypothetical protein